MYLLLVLVSVVLAAAGVAMMRYAVPIEEMSSVALFVSGIVALVGALIIGALAVVARTLGRIAERLEIKPLPLPPVASVGRDDPAPRPARKTAAAARAVAAPPPRRPRPRGGAARGVRARLGWCGGWGGGPPPPPGRAAPPAATPAA